MKKLLIALILVTLSSPLFGQKFGLRRIYFGDNYAQFL